MRPFEATPLVSSCLLVMALWTTGCAQTKTNVYVEVPQNVNGGAPMHMMVRAIPDAIQQETYEEAASLMFIKPQDDSVVLTQPVFPGERFSLALPDVEKNDVVLYFFFTHPDPKDRFRVPLQKPLPAEVFITLGEQAVDRVQMRRR